MAQFPEVRLRRYRLDQGIRRMLGMEFPTPNKFIWPLFIVEGQNVINPIKTLPGQYFCSIDMVTSALEPVIKSGIGAVLLFGFVENNLKTDDGAYAFNENGLVQQAIREIKRHFPEFPIFTDTGVSGYTTHGHNGMSDENGQIDNDATLQLLTKVAISQAEAGASCVAPSGMMDGQIQALRTELDKSGFYQVLIMSYAVKFASNCYDTFPYAVQTPRKHDQRVKTYLAPPNDIQQALREAGLDELEGADFVMVKPAIFYLDVIHQIKNKANVPVVAYNVSGEYSMIHAMAKQNWSDLYPLAGESLLAIHRAGADLIISYWANQYDKIFMEMKR